MVCVSIWSLSFIGSMVSNNSFYDMNQKILTKKWLFPNFQLIPILHLQVMHDNGHWHCSIDYCVKLILVDETLCENCFISHWNDFCFIPLGKCDSWRTATNRWKKIQILNILRAPSIMLYMKSGSMPFKFNHLLKAIEMFYLLKKSLVVTTILPPSFPLLVWINTELGNEGNTVTNSLKWINTFGPDCRT